ncbi:MAG: metallopeptidase family protein, partial [Vicinamibacteria bacterium]
LVAEALDGLPQPFQQLIDNVVVAVEDEPEDEDYEETDTPDDEELFGIFRGAPFFERERFISDLPGQIAIFRGPILRSCATRGEAVREIRDTVVHELGHLLGLGDEEMPY